MYALNILHLELCTEAQLLILPLPSPHFLGEGWDDKGALLMTYEAKIQQLTDSA